MSDNKISAYLLRKLQDLQNATAAGASLEHQMALKAVEDAVFTIEMGAKAIALEEVRFYFDEVKRQPVDPADWVNLQEIIHCDHSNGEGPSWYK